MDSEAKNKVNGAGIYTDESLYRQMFTDHPARMLIVDFNTGDIVESNNSAAAFYGYSMETMKTMNVRQINDMTDEMYEKFCSRIIREKRQCFNIKHRLISGEQRDVEVNTAIIVFHEKIVLYSIIRDITDSIRNEEERAMTEKALRESEERYRMLFMEMLNGFALHEVILDDKGKPHDYRFLAVNPSFEKITGLKRDKAIGKTVRELLPNVEQYWIDTYGHVAITGESIYYENYAADLGRYYESYAYCPKPGQFAVVVNDITRRKEAEQELKRHTQELAVFNKAMIDREKRIIELKEEINRLCRAAGNNEQYPPIWKVENKS